MSKPYPNNFSTSRGTGRYTVSSRYSIFGNANSVSNTEIVPASLRWTLAGSRDSTSSPGYPLSLSCNAFSFASEEISRGIGKMVEKHSTWPFDFYERTQEGDFSDTSIGYYSYLAAPLEKISSLRSSLILKLHDKVRDQVAGWGENVAQGQKSISMIGARLGQIGKSAAALRRGDFAAAARHLGVSPRNGGRAYSAAFARDRTKAFASGWLELQYGWLPLLSDIYNTSLMFEGLLKSKPPKGRATVHGSLQDSIQTASIGATRDTIVLSEYRVDLKYVVLFQSTSTALTSLKSLGLTNPVLLAWELLPFSFLVDWIVPISSFLGQLDTGLGIRFIDGSETSFTKQSVVTEQLAVNKKYNGSTYNGSIISYKDSVRCQRLKQLVMPFTLVPALKNPLSVDHVTNAAALLLTTFKR